MIYPGTDVIVYARTVAEAQDEALQYGIVDAMLDSVTIVTPDNDISVALSLDMDTPWCRTCDLSSENMKRLQARFGTPTQVSVAFGVLNDAYVGAYRGRWQNGRGTPG